MYSKIIESIKRNFFEVEGNSVSDYSTEDDFDNALEASSQFYLDNSWSNDLDSEPGEETKKEIIRCVLETTPF
jgi:hypothetical protein